MRGGLGGFEGATYGHSDGAVGVACMLGLGEGMYETDGEEVNRQQFSMSGCGACRVVMLYIISRVVLYNQGQLGYIVILSDFYGVPTGCLQ